MRKILILALCIAMTLSFSGCGSNYTSSNTTTNSSVKENNSYTINVVKGQYYMTFEDYTASLNGMVSAELQYESMEDLLRRINEKDFTDWDFKIIKLLFPKDEHGTKIFNPNKVHDPSLPDGIILNRLNWKGTEYSYDISGDKIISGCFYYLDDDSFEKEFQKRIYRNHLGDNKVNIKDAKQLSDRNAVAYWYDLLSIYGVSDEYMMLQYNLKNEDGLTYYIDELYMIEISDAIPAQIVIYVPCKEGNFIITLYGFNSRPSEDWLLSFN